MTVPSRLSSLMEGDHHDLDDLLVHFRNTPPSQIASRRELFGRFAAGLRRHIVIEERRLFPRMQAEGPESQRLAQMLLEDHQRIEATLAGLEGALERGPDPTDALEWDLINLLGEHNAREEGFAYPWLDERLSSTELLEVRRDLEENAPPPADEATR